jgi:hypothetical protein
MVGPQVSLPYPSTDCRHPNSFLARVHPVVRILVLLPDEWDTDLRDVRGRNFGDSVSEVHGCNSRPVGDAVRFLAYPS